MRRYFTFLIGVALYAAFCCGSVIAVLWLAWNTGAISQSNKLWISSLRADSGSMSVFVWDPANSNRENLLHITGGSQTIFLDRHSGSATIKTKETESAFDWSPESLRNFAIRCGFLHDEVSTEASIELYDAIESIRLNGKKAMSYRSTIFNDHSDSNAPRMTHWEAHGPGIRVVPETASISVLFVAWFCCQAAAVFGIYKLLYGRVSAHSDSQTPG